MKTKPLWPLTYVRAARWLDCDPRTVSRFAQRRKVTFAVFRDLIYQGVGNARERWSVGAKSIVVWRRNTASVFVTAQGSIAVGIEFGLTSVELIRDDFHGIGNKRAALDFQDIAKLRNLTIEEVEAAIAFPW